MTYLLSFYVFLALNGLSLQASTPDSPTYIGAVVEYHPVDQGDDGEMIAEANAVNYRTIIKTASLYEVDIIVFPEFGLTTPPRDEVTNRGKRFNDAEFRAYYRDTASYVPSPNDSIVLCEADSKNVKNSLQSISCAAREFKMYVVVNHHERVECPSNKAHCASDGFLLYNTNVVFDREGRVIARYRKRHLFNEIGTNVTNYNNNESDRAEEDRLSKFSTDFGVTFAQIICFDILHEEPAARLAKEANVTDVIFPSHWFDELPFLTARQEQAAWAYAADVNLLAAGYSDALTASGGSGIYAGRSGPIKAYSSEWTSNALIVAEIPKLNSRRRRGPVAGLSKLAPPSVHVFKQAEVPTLSGMPRHLQKPNEFGFDEDLSAFTSLLLELGKESHIETLCDRGLCCDFHIEMSYEPKLAETPNTRQHRYRLLVFNGVRAFGNITTVGLQICAVVSCAGDSLSDCNKQYPRDSNLIAPTIFDSLIISRRADLSTRSLYSPTTLVAATPFPTSTSSPASQSNELRPMDGSDFAYVSAGKSNDSLLLAYIVNPRNDLVTFGIFGRIFSRDGQPETRPIPSAASIIRTSVLLVSAVTIYWAMKL
ncbi:hypothetical protein QAD02_023377 [Eretmocerus hayati]|uniref:Uncharacterized protein n=1 Tax=Eretmocerus hayati TaxID=131215 RepID=A0ACC2PXA6_9HYME|nr:hypothetical protein QAD02_023377 [Eretmocerus hayati]